MIKELKQKAEEWVKDNTRIEHSASFGEIEVEPSAEKGYIAGATEATKELQEQNEYLNNLVKEKVQRGLEIQEDLLKEKADLAKQIKQAKEIIKKFNSYHKTPYCEGERELWEEAETFLKKTE